MRTLTPCIKKKYSNEDFGMLNIRETENRKSVYHSLKETIYLKDWNDKRKLVKNIHPEHERLNGLILDKIKELKDFGGEVKVINKQSFFSYLEGEMLNLENRGQISTYKKYKTLYYHLKEYVKTIRNKTDLLFSEIDNVFIRDLETYFIKQGLGNNSYKTYIRFFRTSFNRSLKLNIYHTVKNPFSTFEYSLTETTKKMLSKMELERIILEPFERSNPLFDTRNYFLFQFYCQGIRVSDLTTLRWGNINPQTGDIEFIQFKTKKFHRITINERMTSLLLSYSNIDTSKVINQKYKFSISTGKFKGQYSMNINEVKTFFNQSKGNPLDKETYNNLEPIKKVLEDISFKVFSQLLLLIISYSKQHKTDFIFPLLKSSDFENVLFNEDTRLSKYQYNQLQSKTTIYNKNLKLLQKHHNIETKLTSHLSRHTYTNLMLQLDSDVFVLSRSLGHQTIKTTQHYIGNSFHSNRVNEGNEKLIGQFRFLEG